MIKILDNFLDFLFPPRCAGCGMAGNYLCLSCRAALPRLRNYPADSEIEAFFGYRGTALQPLIWKLKYRGGRDIAKIMGELLWENLAEKMSEVKLFSGNKPIILIPVPVHPEKRKERGFNQMELIAEEISKLDTDGLFLYSPDTLEKTKKTPPQMEMKERKKRKENIVDAFTVSRPENIRGKTVLVIDDVTTTGATLLEAKKTLLSAGARKVYLTALSH